MAETEYNRIELEQKVLDGTERENYIKALETAAEARKKILAKGITTSELENALAILEEMRVRVYSRRIAAKVQSRKNTVKKTVKKNPVRTTEAAVQETAEE